LKAKKPAPLVFSDNMEQRLHPEIFEYNDCSAGQFINRGFENKPDLIELALIFLVLLSLHQGKESNTRSS
jgi:hypothetical protein